MADPKAAPGATRKQNVWRNLADPLYATMALLGLGSGTPFLLVFSTLSLRLAEAGVTLLETLLGLVAGVAYGILAGLARKW